MPKQFQYSCGCSFNVIDKEDQKSAVVFNPDISKIDLACSRTWDLISSGNTKGVFQLESRLGRSIAKKLKPENIEQLSALIAILRPGTLEAVRDGKTVTNHYIDKKNLQESVDYFHPSLEPILRSTYGEMIYQEQAMAISKELAGFTLQEADMLRKAIGKKKPEEMAKVKDTFLKGSKRLGVVTEDEAEQIFGWIEKSQRYSFNKSHSVSYAINAYLSAYAKAHFPKIFFASYLRFAKDKIDPQSEIKELIQNANEMDISVYPPDIRNLNKFFIIQNDRIYFGLTDIKGVGESVFKKIVSIIEGSSIKMIDIDWMTLLLNVLLKINSGAAKAMILSGATSFIKKTRNAMLFEYNAISQLTAKEQAFLLTNIKHDNIISSLKFVSEHCKMNKNRKVIVEDIIKSLLNPPYSLEDSSEWISDSEDTHLGYAITCAKIDAYDISMTNTSCKEFQTTLLSDNIILGGEIDGISIIQTKTGKNPGQDMAFVTLIDSTGCLDSVIFFPEQYKTYKNIIYDGNIIIIAGNKSKKGDSLIVQKAYIAKS